MSFNLAELSACVKARGAVVRVLVQSTKGSVPRGVGAVMLVWQEGQSDTIGGGALEYKASKLARKMLVDAVQVLQLSEPLGPAIDQCCGGRVDLVLERFDLQNLPLDNSEIFARPIGENAANIMPDKLRSDINMPVMFKGWMAEPLNQVQIPIWIFGAGHVGRALAIMLAPLPEFSVNLIDSADNRMPVDFPENITPLINASMTDLIKPAPENTHHLVMTKSHRCDLEICHGLLNRGFETAGLIGSKTKWARFRSQLQKMGHSLDKINCISCPIGSPEPGKEPQAIAVGIAHRLLQMRRLTESAKDVLNMERGNDGKSAGN